jgi:hypothetical protein
MSTMISVRLDDDELVALRKNPGANDAARVRALVQSAAISDAIADRVAALLGEKLDQIASATSAHDEKLRNLTLHVVKLRDAITPPNEGA